MNTKWIGAFTWVWMILRGKISDMGQALSLKYYLDHMMVLESLLAYLEGRRLAL